jgi:nucleotide-binding universal stress UspA family protein
MISIVAVGTDGSDTAQRALVAGLELAERFGAEVVFLSAYTGKDHLSARGNDGHGSLEEQWAANPADAVRLMLEEAEARARERGLRARSEASEGDPADVLVRLAEKHQADILVIGNKGMQRRVLGSVPNSVTHRAPCSVYVVKTT